MNIEIISAVILATILLVVLLVYIFPATPLCSSHHHEKFVQYNLNELNFHRPLIDCDTNCIKKYNICAGKCKNHTCINDCGIPLLYDCMNTCKDNRFSLK